MNKLFFTILLVAVVAAVANLVYCLKVPHTLPFFINALGNPVLSLQWSALIVLIIAGNEVSSS